MYRRAVMMEQERAANDHFITRLGSLPVVNSAWLQACDLYQKTKERNAFLKATCNLAEGGVQTVVSTTKPLVEKCQPQIEQVNAFACQKLAVMEENYPVITKPTEELIQDGRDKCVTVLKPVTDKVNTVRDTYNGIVTKSHETVDAAKGTVEAMKEYGMTTVSKTLETPMGRFAMEKVNEALTVSEEYVEKYLPANEDEAEVEGNAPVEVDEVNTLTRVTSLSSKLRQRMYKRALRDLKGLQVRSKEKMESLHFTIDLIQYAKSSAGGAKELLEEKYEIAQRKAVDVWDQINDEEDEDDNIPSTFEGKTIVVARHLTRQVKQGVATVSGYLPEKLQPEIIRERLSNARQYTEELYLSFKEAQGFDDLPSWVLVQAKEKMFYIQETVSFLSETFLVAPINWVVRTPSVEPTPREEPTPRASVPHPNGEEDVEMEPLDTNSRGEVEMEPLETKEEEE